MSLSCQPHNPLSLEPPPSQATHDRYRLQDKEPEPLLTIEASQGIVPFHQQLRRNTNYTIIKRTMLSLHFPEHSTTASSTSTEPPLAGTRSSTSNRPSGHANVTTIIACILVLPNQFRIVGNQTENYAINHHGIKNVLPTEPLLASFSFTINSRDWTLHITTSSGTQFHII